MAGAAPALAQRLAANRAGSFAPSRKIFARAWPVPRLVRGFADGRRRSRRDARPVFHRLYALALRLWRSARAAHAVSIGGEHDDRRGADRRARLDPRAGGGRAAPARARPPALGDPAFAGLLLPHQPCRMAGAFRTLSSALSLGQDRARRAARAAAGAGLDGGARSRLTSRAAFLLCRLFHGPIARHSGTLKYVRRRSHRRRSGLEGLAVRGGAQAHPPP